MEDFKMSDFYVYGAWGTSETNFDASNALHIGKGSGDRLNADHPNVPNYGTLKHLKFKNLKNLTEEQALSEERRLIEKYKPRYNENLK